MAVSVLANRKSAQNVGLGASLSGLARLRPAGPPAGGLALQDKCVLSDGVSQMLTQIEANR